MWIFSWTREAGLSPKVSAPDHLSLKYRGVLHLFLDETHKYSTLVIYQGDFIWLGRASSSIRMQSQCSTLSSSSQIAIVKIHLHSYGS